MEVEGVTVQKIIEPKLLGVHNAHNVWLCHGKYGEYLRYNSLNYSIPAWAKMENLNEPFGIAYATKILDWKIQNKVPRGEAGCKPIEDPILLGVHNGHDVWLCNGKYSKYIKYNGSNFSIPGMPKDYNLQQTFDYAIKTFKCDKKIDVSENECPWYTKDTL